MTGSFDAPEPLDGPLFPESADEILRAILDPQPEPGTHVFRNPPTEYDAAGEPLFAPARSAFTLDYVTVPTERQPAPVSASYADMFASIKGLYAALPPPEPIRATRSQMALLKAVLPVVPERKPWDPQPWMMGVPVYLVEDFEESTPWLRKWAAPYCEVPFPTARPDGFGNAEAPADEAGA